MNTTPSLRSRRPLTSAARRVLAACAGCMVVTVLTGCGAYGLNSLPLPGVSAGGDAIAVTARIADVQNLVPNTVVKSANVDVGVIRGITTDGNLASVRMELRRDADLPRNSTVKLAQLSLLGAQYLEITPQSGPSVPLADGDVIDSDQTAEYPSTERVLSALASVLNGSGLQQIRTITSELNNAMDGNQERIRSLIPRMQTLVAGLNRQRESIVEAIDQVDRFAKTLSDQAGTLDRGIQSLDPALEVLNEQRSQLVTMLDSMRRFADTADRTVSGSYEDLKRSLVSLAPTLAKLSEAGESIPGALLLGATFPFPVTTIDRAIRGDYVNLFLTLDLSAETITNKVLPSLPKGARELLYTSLQNVDPILDPISGRKAGPR